MVSSESRGQISSLHHPVTLMSTLPVSQLAGQDSHDPLLLCCCFVLRESRPAGTRRCLVGFIRLCFRWGKGKMSTCVKAAAHPSAVREVEEARSCSWNLLVRLGASLKRKHSSARGHKQAYSTFQKPAGCDFSTPSHGLGYSACLCELMLLPQCLSSLYWCIPPIWNHNLTVTGKPIMLKAALRFFTVKTEPLGVLSDCSQTSQHSELPQQLY